MITLAELHTELEQGKSHQYVSDRSINLYNNPAQEGLVTQADAGHHLRVLEIADDKSALRVRIIKDDYPGWIAASHLSDLKRAEASYDPPRLSESAIAARLLQVVAFAQDAMAVPNEYLWGGATAPNYDCSGLVQAAFMSAGIQLPRDSYQQEAFTARINQSDLQPGDLIFFGTPEKTTHVALYIGSGKYIHSSGKDMGRNGIGIDSIVDLSDPVSQGYHKQLRCFGRVSQSYQPAKEPPDDHR